MLRVKYSEEVERAMKTLYETLSEKDRRRYAAAEALKLGRGGQRYVCRVLGCDPATVKRGTDELQNQKADAYPRRIRKPGGGRKKTTVKIKNADELFFDILKYHTAGSPMDEQITWTNLGMKDMRKSLSGVWL
jgi:hypothetical protein